MTRIWGGESHQRKHPERTWGPQSDGCKELNSPKKLNRGPQDSDEMLVQPIPWPQPCETWRRKPSYPVPRILNAETAWWSSIGLLQNTKCGVVCSTAIDNGYTLSCDLGQVASHFWAPVSSSAQLWGCKESRMYNSLAQEENGLFCVHSSLWRDFRVGEQEGSSCIFEKMTIFFFLSLGGFLREGDE